MLHCIRIKTNSPGQAPPYRTTQVIDNWVGRYRERLPEQRQQAQGIEADPERGVPEHIVGLYRFASEEDRAAMLDDLETDLSDIGAISWAVLQPHTCWHDEENDDGCIENTDERRTIGSPPEVLL